MRPPQDFRHAVRFIRRSPVLATMATVSFAIGIGATTAVLNVADAVLLRTPAGVADPDRVVDIGFSQAGRGFGSGSYLNYADIAARTTTLSEVYAHLRFPVRITFNVDGVPEAAF